jgi:peptidoglycan-N-acetylglucosamine deacetylase
MRVNRNPARPVIPTFRPVPAWCLLLVAAAACRGEHDRLPPGAEPPANGSPTAAAPAAPIAVAITIDDLPWVGALPRGESRAEATRRLLSGLNRHRAPATGFVNCGRAGGEGGVLRLWREAGMQLGNHTSQHMDLNRAPLSAWLQDVRSCDTVLREITGEPFLFFRYPYLHEGRTPERWEAARRLLDELESPPAHVTLHTADWVLAAAYGRGLRESDTALAERIGEEFIEHVVRVLHHYERVAHDRVGRSIAHVMLLHANALVADHLEPLLVRLREEGVRFVPLAEALDDPVYARANEYVGPEGLSWLYRFAPAAPDLAAWDDAEVARLRAAFPR